MASISIPISIYFNISHIIIENKKRECMYSLN